MKKLIVLGIIVVCIASMYRYPHAMLNPGELAEGHQKLNDKCLDCHTPFWGLANDKCISCHKLSDIGKDTLHASAADGAGAKILFHQHLSNQKCTYCHTDHKGIKPEILLSSFHHEMLPAVMMNDCNSCHGQPSGNLHKQLSVECSGCHVTIGWKTSVKFNHDMIVGDGKNNCASCHKYPDDDFHQDIKDNCNKCHSTNQWKPSTFDHSEYFILDGEHNRKCSTCHTGNNYSSFTCYGCHEHSESKITEEHNEHGISNFARCASCHRSGNEHDIRMNENPGRNSNQDDLMNSEKRINSQKKNKEKEDEENKEHDNE